MFDLVDNATFHNGETFSADDVVYTFERILDPKTASSYAPLYNAISTVEATGPTQVTFHLKTPFGPFLSNLANNGEIVNQKAIESKDPARNAIGTGPFEFVEWVQGDHITLKKNDNYFLEGKPYLDGIEFQFLLVDQSRIDALRSGELELVRRGTAPAAEHAQDRSVVQLRDVGDRRHPRLHRDEHDEAAVQRQADPAGGLLGARPRRRSGRSPTSARASPASRRCRPARAGSTARRS